jgi:hypothetical protein
MTRTDAEIEPSYVAIEDEAGDPCPRCGEPTQIREHAAITEKHLRQPFYYSRWFCCINPHCATKEIMPHRFRVWADTREIWEDPPKSPVELSGDPPWDDHGRHSGS